MKRLDGAPRQRLTDDQVEHIRRSWATDTSIDIAMRLNVRIGTVKACASRLGLKKQPEVLTSIRRKAAGPLPRWPKDEQGAPVRPVRVQRSKPLKPKRRSNVLVIPSLPMGKLSPIVRADVDRAVVRFDARAGR